MHWIVKTVTSVVAGAALLSALERLGWYRARAFVEWISSFIDTQVLGLIFAPFTWIEFAWFSVSIGEYATVVLVWAVMIAPAVKNVGISSQPDAGLLTMPPDPVLRLFGLMFIGPIFALLLGLFCFLVPHPFSIWLLIGWMSYLQVGILMATFNLLRLKPRSEEEFYELAAGRIRMRMLWSAYGETALGAIVLTAIDKLL